MRDLELEIMSEVEIDNLTKRKNSLLFGRRMRIAVIIAAITSYVVGAGYVYVNNILDSSLLNVFLVYSDAVLVSLSALVEKCYTDKYEYKKQAEVSEISKKVSLLRDIQEEVEKGKNRFQYVPTEDFKIAYNNYYESRQTEFFYSRCPECGAKLVDSVCCYCGPIDEKGNNIKLKIIKEI